MTAYRQIGNTKYKRTNRKDRQPRPRQTSAADNFEAAGFKFISPPATWAYTWPGANVPTFTVAPGVLNLRPGMIATYDAIAIRFDYGAKAKAIAARLDDEILEVMRHDAALVDAPLNWREMETEGLAIDIDDFMAV